MKHDIWRFISFFIISLFIGYISGHISICISIGLILFIYFQHREFTKVLLWLKEQQPINKKPIEGVACDVYDEIKLLKDHCSSQKLKLSSYLKKTQEAIKALPDSIIILGSNGKIEWANNKANDYLGINWPKDDGLRISYLIRDKVLINYLDKEKFEEGLQIDSPINEAIKLYVHVISYAANQKLFVAKDVTLITEVTQIQKKFISNVSHELRTPLTVISGYLDNFAEDGLCPDKWSSYIQQMRSQSDRMRKLINGLLELSSLEAHADVRDIEIINIFDILNQIIEELSSLDCCKHEFILKVDDKICLKVNLQHIYSVFSNLIYNAVLHTPEKTKINIKWYKYKENACFSVQDNGFGVDPKHIPRLTESFYRVYKGYAKNKESTGLGLSIVKHILDKYRGNIHVESVLGKGSLFICEFPKPYIRESTKEL